MFVSLTLFPSLFLGEEGNAFFCFVLLRYNIYWRVTYWESVKKAKHSVIREEYDVVGLGDDDDVLCFLIK